MTTRSLRWGLPAPVLALAFAATPAPAGDILPGLGHGTTAGSSCAGGNCTKHNTRLGSDCPTCLNGKWGIGWRHRPTVPTLAPGACFGYFPTQWNRWEDVCPLPYGGAPEPPPGPNKGTKSANLPEPRPAGDGTTDPKAKGSDQPIAPKAGAGKGTDLPKTDLPKTDLPKTDLPKTDLPKSDPPKPQGPGGPRGASADPLPSIPTALPPLPGKF